MYFHLIQKNNSPMPNKNELNAKSFLKQYKIQFDHNTKSKLISVQNQICSQYKISLVSVQNQILHRYEKLPLPHFHAGVKLTRGLARQNGGTVRAQRSLFLKLYHK